MRLSQILQGAAVIRQTAPADLDIAAVTLDSRRVTPGALFAAIPGFKTDGRRFIADAAAAGAAAVLTEEWPTDADIPVVQVESARPAVALAAANFYGRPSQKLTLTGVTGTNGKTTTTYMIDAILRASGRRTGLLGGIEYRLDGRSEPAARTTPEAVDPQRLLAEMAAGGVEAAVIEVSSHGIELSRADCLDFDVAVFTNLSPEHLDLHGDMESYYAIKRRLFIGPLPCGRPERGAAPRAVVNIDDSYGRRLAAELADAVTFGLAEGASVTAAGLRTGGWQSSFRLKLPAGEAPVSLSVPGGYNILNALGAAAAALAQGLPPDAITAGLEGFAGVPGRFEPVGTGTPFRVVVDYAHNEDGLRQALLTARSLSRGRVITVFGCPGERDREKRPGMGRTAGSLSDVSILTTDDCYGEDPEAIMDETEPGLAASGGEFRRIGDRREAIAAAIGMAEPGDIVVVAGKGHEDRQIMADGARPFSDRDVILGLLPDH